MSVRRLDERGVTVVEAALVVPVVLLFVFGLIDMGLWAFESTKAAAAARDGARAAILDTVFADVAGSADEVTVRAATTRRIDARDVDIDIACSRPDGSRIACDDAIAGDDRVKVSVSWDREFVTFVGGMFGGRAAHISAESTMVIVGRPVDASGSGA